jgi:hypothetical protein
MGMLLLAFTAVVSVPAFRFWSKFFERRLKPVSGSTDLADAAMLDWPGIIALLLPRPLRRVWNAMILGACLLFFGIPHFLVIWNISGRGGEPDPLMYVHYSWTLMYWLVLLAAPAFLMVRHRQSLSRQGEEPLSASAAAMNLWHIWVHGLTFTMVCVFSVLIVFATVFAAALIIMTFSMIVGQRIEPYTLARLVFYLSPIWLPFGVGAAARYSDHFKLPGYPKRTEPSGTI